MAFFLAPGARIPGIPSRGEPPGPRTGRGPPPERNPPLSVRWGRPGSRGLPPRWPPRELPPGTGSGVPGRGVDAGEPPFARGPPPPPASPGRGGGLPPLQPALGGGGPPPPQDGPGRGSAPAVDHPPGPTPGSPSRGRLGAPSRPPRRPSSAFGSRRRSNRRSEWVRIYHRGGRSKSPLGVGQNLPSRGGAKYTLDGWFPRVWRRYPFRRHRAVMVPGFPGSPKGTMGEPGNRTQLLRGMVPGTIREPSGTMGTIEISELSFLGVL
jgi:hypothetical protein